MNAPFEQPQAQENEPSALDRLIAYMGMDNIAAELQDMDSGDERSLGRIAEDVLSGYKMDKESCNEWRQRNEDAIDLAKLVSGDKDYPFVGASNIKYPLLTEAALQFNARCYPAIVQGNRVAKCKTWGEDDDGSKAARADRVSEYQSYQLLAEMPEWEEDTDKLTVMLPLTGAMYRKVYYDPSLGRNASRLLPPDKVVKNYFATSIKTAPRVTEELELYPYEIQERINSGRFLEFDYKGTNAANPEKEGDQDRANDDLAAHAFLEQHTRIDLDGDGYPEPYIVTVHQPTEKVVRIVANYDEDSVSINTENDTVSAIRKNEYFIEYIFLPSMDGGGYGLGLGSLLKDITEAINTSLNQMMDAGHLSNVQGGLISASAGIREKSIRLEMGEWHTIKTNVPLNQAVFPIKYDGPSPVLFQLLGFLVESGKSIAAIKDILTGEVRQNMTASATLALIEQGLQVFTAIFKRIHRSLKAELGAYARLNRKYLDAERYNALFDSQDQFDPAQDFSEADMDILPVSDPNVSSRMQELAKANFLREVAQNNPTMNPHAVTQRVLEAAQVENIEELLVPPPQPDPITEELMLRNAFAELNAKEADTVKSTAAALRDLAAADGEEQKSSLARAGLILQAIKAELEAENGQAGLSAVEGQPGNPMGAGADAQGSGALGSGPEGPAGIRGANPDTGAMGQPASAGGV